MKVLDQVSIYLFGAYTINISHQKKIENLSEIDFKRLLVEMSSSEIKSVWLRSLPPSAYMSDRFQALKNCILANHSIEEFSISGVDLSHTENEFFIETLIDFFHHACFRCIKLTNVGLYNLSLPLFSRMIASMFSNDRGKICIDEIDKNYKWDDGDHDYTKGLLAPSSEHKQVILKCLSTSSLGYFQCFGFTSQEGDEINERLTVNRAIRRFRPSQEYSRGVHYLLGQELVRYHSNENFKNVLTEKEFVELGVLCLDGIRNESITVSADLINAHGNYLLKYTDFYRRRIDDFSDVETAPHFWEIKISNPLVEFIKGDLPRNKHILETVTLKLAKILSVPVDAAFLEGTFEITVTGFNQACALFAERVRQQQIQQPT